MLALARLMHARNHCVLVIYLLWLHKHYHSLATLSTFEGWLVNKFLPIILSGIMLFTFCIMLALYSSWHSIALDDDSIFMNALLEHFNKRTDLVNSILSTVHLSALSIHPDCSIREYISIYFKFIFHKHYTASIMLIIMPAYLMYVSLMTIIRSL